MSSRFSPSSTARRPPSVCTAQRPSAPIPTDQLPTLLKARFYTEDKTPNPPPPIDHVVADLLKDPGAPRWTASHDAPNDHYSIEANYNEDDGLWLITYYRETATLLSFTQEWADQPPIKQDPLYLALLHHYLPTLNYTTWASIWAP